MKNSSKLLTLGKVDVSITLLSLTRNFQHQLTAFAIEPAHARQSSCGGMACSRLIAISNTNSRDFQRPVISCPRSRNFRASEITSRWWRACPLSANV